MIRIDRAQLSFHGFRGGPERATAIARRALGELASRDPAAAPATVPPRVQLTVRVPHGASDAAIADRVREALRGIGRGDPLRRPMSRTARP